LDLINSKTADSVQKMVNNNQLSKH